MENNLKISAKNLGKVMLEDFCPRCFWIELKSKLPWQSFPGIFSSIDSYTKHCVHKMIDSENKPEWMKQIGDVVGYKPIPHWSKSLFLDTKTGITISGAGDDIWVKSDGGNVIVDFKTAKFSPNQDKLFPMYEVQIIAYDILYKLNADLYLIYMEPNASPKDTIVHESGFDMRFTPKIVPIENDKRKVRYALTVTKEIFDLKKPPEPKSGCKNCGLLGELISKIK